MARSDPLPRRLPAAFWLLALINLLVGGMVGLERSVVPPLGLATSLGPLLVAAVVLGLGTGMVYPTLIALVADRVPSASRATALGVYRFVRDGGYALGAIVAAIGFSALPGAIVGVGVGMLVLTLVTWKEV